MKLIMLLTCASLPLLSSLPAQAQSDEVQKVEVGVHFTSITKPDFNNGATEPGFGGRFTLNLNRSVALEAVGNFFPHSCRFCGGGSVAGDNSGNLAQGFFGVKAGKRFEKWGIFAKARPGVVSFSEGDSSYVSTAAGGSFPFELRQQRLTNFAVDLGGVLEFYPTKRLVTRFEGGDTLIHYRSRQTNFIGFDPTTSTGFLIPFSTRSETRHNFQFAAGVGWRF
ncbi:MAG TPA: hypothetical protein VIW64_13425 [Pyrinomonadaceae bacterium]